MLNNRMSHHGQRFPGAGLRRWVALAAGGYRPAVWVVAVAMAVLAASPAMAVPRLNNGTFDGGFFSFWGGRMPNYWGAIWRGDFREVKYERKALGAPHGEVVHLDDLALGFEAGYVQQVADLSPGQPFVFSAQGCSYDAGTRLWMAVDPQGGATLPSRSVELAGKSGLWRRQQIEGTVGSTGTVTVFLWAWREKGEATDVYFDNAQLEVKPVGGYEPPLASLVSPRGGLKVELTLGGQGRLRYRIRQGGRVALDDSPVGLVVDGQDLGTNVVKVTPARPIRIERTLQCRGVRSDALDLYHEYMVRAERESARDPVMVMTWRVYDDGVAYRYHLPGDGERRISGEASGWSLPWRTTLWGQTQTEYYEGLYEPSLVGSATTVFGPPVVAVLPATPSQPSVYVVATEAALYDYPGMTLSVREGSRTLSAHFAYDKTWEASAGFATPWRVTLVSTTLHTLVNSSVIQSVNPDSPDKLRNAPWIRPGRATWSWWAKRDKEWHARLEDQAHYIDAAAELGFEYVVFDEGHMDWPRDAFEKLLRRAKDKGVHVWLWYHSNTLETEAQRSERFDWIDAWNDKIGDKVVVGLKVDFMNSESRERMRWYKAILEEAAEHELMLNFHGANKPTGIECRYPHEMTREGVRGLEYNLFDKELPPSHDAALPFTRLLAGHADYTPVTFFNDKLGTTTYAHQLAMAFVLTSPLTHLADDPARYIESPARDVIAALPTVWDETVVLPDSRIGTLAVFARRAGKRWFLAVVHGGGASRTLPIALSFLGDGSYEAVLLGDVMDDPAAFDRRERTATSVETLDIHLRPGGGFVGMFTPVR